MGFREREQGSQESTGILLKDPTRDSRKSDAEETTLRKPASGKCSARVEVLGTMTPQIITYSLYILILSPVFLDRDVKVGPPHSVLVDIEDRNR